MSFYNNRKGLEEFQDKLLQCHQLMKQLEEGGGCGVEKKNFNDIYDCVDEIIHEDSEVELEIEALGAYDDVFTVVIRSYAGIVYWIQANEFDDIKYFENKEHAVDCAYDEFSSYIDGLSDLRERGEHV